MVALVAGLFSLVRAFQATRELARSREREAQIAAVYAEIRELRHELYYSQVSPKDLLVELDRTEEQLQNGHSSLDQTRIKLRSLRNELAESQQRSEVLRGGKRNVQERAKIILSSACKTRSFGRQRRDTHGLSSSDHCGLEKVVTFVL